MGQITIIGKLKKGGSTRLRKFGRRMAGVGFVGFMGPVNTGAENSGSFSAQ